MYIYLNDLFLCLYNSDLYNFADNNTITSTIKGFNDLLHTFEKVTERTDN